MTTFVNKFLAHSPKETRELGQKIGRLLKAGDLLTLEGPLGSGKTTLVKGIAKGLDVKDPAEVVSPTFVLIHEYEAREKIYHIDWYRLLKVKGQDKLLAQECFDSQGVTLVEWAERGKGIFPKEYIQIHMKYQGPDKRVIEISVKGKKNRNLIGSL